MADIQRTILDLDTFEEVVVTHPVSEAPEITSVEQALTLVGNDASKLFSIIRKGIQSDIGKAAAEATDGWTVKETGESFRGTRANLDDFNDLVLTLAKTLGLGWEEAGNHEEKLAVKAKAVELIKTTPMLRDGLKKKAAAAGK